MDEFCKKQFIFFNENDRVKYQIKRSKHLFQEFRNSMNKGFKNMQVFEDHPDLKDLLKEDE